MRPRRLCRLPGHEHRGLLALAGDRQHHHRPVQAGAPGASAREQGLVGLQVEFQVAADAHLGDAGLAQPVGVLGGLRQRQAQAAGRGRQQRLELLAAAQAARGEPRVGQDHRHAGLQRLVLDVGPDLGFHQHADRGPGAPQESPHRARRVEGQPALRVAVAQERAAGFPAGRRGVGEQQAQAGPLAPQLLDERRGGACFAQRDRMDPDRAGFDRRAEAEAFGRMRRVERLLAAAQEQAQEVRRRGEPQHRAEDAARQALLERVRRHRQRAPLNGPR